MQRKSSNRIALYIAVLAVLAVFGTFVPASSAQPLQTGIVGTDSQTFSSLGMQRVRNAAGTYIKITVPWTTVAPNTATKPAGFNATDPASPSYNFSAVDDSVRNAVAAGLQPLITVTDSPPWARAPGCTRRIICTPNPSDYADFATAIARRYSGTFDPVGTASGANLLANGVTLPRVSYWQAWVEPNLFLFYAPQFRRGRKVSPANYRGILNAFASAIKTVNPTNTVLSAGLAPLQRPGGLGPLDFTRRLLCLAGPRNRPHAQAGCPPSQFDVYAMHPYTTGGPTHKAAGRWDISLGNLPVLARTLHAAQRGGKSHSSRLWVTEFSWDSRPPDPGGLKLGLWERWMDEAFYRMWNAGVSAVFWFGLRDEGKDGGWGDSAQSGLYYLGQGRRQDYIRGNAPISQDVPKRGAITAFGFPFVALRHGGKILVWGRTPDGGPRSVQIQQSTGGGFHQVATLQSDANGIFTQTISTGSNRGFLRAAEGGRTSLPFSLRYVHDFYEPPFGGGGQSPNTPIG